MMTVNDSFPGPVIRVHKGDTAYVNVHNQGDFSVTIHWHGVKQPRNPWSDGRVYITHCLIEPGTNFMYEIIFSQEAGTLWNQRSRCVRGSPDAYARVCLLCGGSGDRHFDNETDPKGYNLIDPPELNTISVPKKGWVAIGFRANNPRVWLWHCHFDRHYSWGMNTVLIVKNGGTPETNARYPPPKMPPRATSALQLWEADEFSGAPFS
ncbi:hypothetical protein CRG98_021566 [Punica granatum]|uniref:Plastocyanin-like domain-containing protein n=1 Tax=Punica granatum TaxID=22663 RepID=A0A2I0JQ93_PUNGR|nr:hypothetical protein CRG98_021566 [Punica granatum]